MTKFYQLLVNNNENLASRAASVEVKARNAQKKIIQSLEDAIESAKLRELDLLDLGPEESTSLRPVDKNWNASEWAEQLQCIKVELYNLSVKLELARSVYKELFTEPDNGTTV